METAKRTQQQPDWREARSILAGKLSTEEDRILKMLAEGKTQPEIGVALGLHRSAVWRRVQKLRRRLTATPPDIEK